METTLRKFLADQEQFCNEQFRRRAAQVRQKGVRPHTVVEEKIGGYLVGFKYKGDQIHAVAEVAQEVVATTPAAAFPHSGLYTSLAEYDFAPGLRVDLKSPAHRLIVPFGV